MREDCSDEPRARSRSRTRVTAVHKSLDLLTRRDHARHELRTKLRAREYEHTEIDAAIEKMESWGYLNEPRFIEGFVRQRAQRGEGPRLIMQRLLAKGVDKANIMQYAAWEDIDWVALAQQTHAKRLVNAVAAWPERQKCIDFLMGKGFSTSQIYQILSEWVEKYDSQDS